MASVIHALPYPCVEFGNISFPNGEYDVEVHSLAGGTSIQVTHKLDNVPFIQNLLQKDQAKYGCLLAVPVTGYRKLSLSSERVHEISWDIGILGEPPIIRPVILASENFEHEFSSSDGVAQIWVGKKIKVPKGARLARGPYLRSDSSLQSLLNIQEDESLEGGSFTVSSNMDGGFTFDVRVATDVYKFLSNSSLDPRLYQSIGAHMASMVFVTLKEEQGYDDDGNKKWEEHSNLKMLSGILEEKGLPHWAETEHGTKKADEISLNLHPLLLPDIPEDE